MVINDPDFDPSIYQADIPPGYTVYDKATGRTYSTGPTTRQLEDDLLRAVEEGLRLQEKGQKKETGK